MPTVLSPVSWLASLFVGMVIAGVMAGMLIGVVVATFVPGYYAGVVPGWDPLTYGVGAGLIQGGVAGFGIGALAVCVAAYRMGPRLNGSDPQAATFSRTFRLAMLGCLLLVPGLIVGGLVGNAFGQHLGRQDIRRAEGQVYADAIAAAIDDGDVYVGKQFVDAYAAVASEDEARYLRAAIERAIGAAAIESGRINVEVTVVESGVSN